MCDFMKESAPAAKLSVIHKLVRVHRWYAWFVEAVVDFILAAVLVKKLLCVGLCPGVVDC
jgi:hypothetical protein